MKSWVDYRKILDICWKHRLCVEVMPTVSAVGTFNFLNSEGRYVAAGIIPPHRLDHYDEANLKASRILLSEQDEDVQQPLLQNPTDLKLLTSGEYKGISVARSPLAKICIQSLSCCQPPPSTSVAATSKAPLIKDFFKGQINLELFEFPELETRQQVDDLNAMHNQIKEYILKMNSYEIDQKSSLSKETIRKMNEIGLLCLNIDSKYNGLGFNTTYWIRACEAIGLDASVWATVTAHQSLTAKAISLLGTTEQKMYYLPKLASGEYIGAFCLSEISSGNDIQALTSLAVSSETDDHYLLNGCKVWITNGAVADVFIVFARTHCNNTDTDSNEMTAFIVDRSLDGIECGPLLDTFGARGSNANNITFNNVKIPKKNILGKHGGGFKLAQDVLISHRLNTVAANVGVLRYLLTYITEHCLQRHQFGKPIGDYSRVEENLSEIVLNLYAMESGLFYLSGLLDAQPSRDLSLELAALKIFSSEKTCSGIDTCIQLAGRFGLLKDVPFERFLRDSKNHLTSMESNDILRILIAGEGFSSVIPDFQETVAKLSVYTRHPITVTKHRWLCKGRKRGWFAAKTGSGPKVTEGNASRDLKDHLHPTFGKMSTELAINTQRFQSLCEITLIEHGREIIDEQMVLCRIADAAIDLLLTSICFGRASRSISIGVHRSDYEKTLTHAFSRLALRRVEQIIATRSEIDRYRHRIASELLTQRSYPVLHPLTRVW
ncbi:unnamed protein product [Heterobilharzia americana]|nr:unnamed protein product [Heterobilharzia americana]